MKLNEKRIVNDIRLLSLDMINNAGSGHPGIVLSAAPTLYTLFAYHLKFDLERKSWCNRDRFVMSAGHGSSLLYATLFYLLDEFNIQELKDFRKISSQCNGHPEYNLNNRIEMTTGPLGEGFATSVGMAIGEKYLESSFNRKKNTVFNYNIYTLVSDGDLMEGISYEAASLAGNLGLDNLIVLYDSNGVTADGPLDKAMYENIGDRFISMNWEVIKVKNGEDIGEISNAIDKAKKCKKPVLIEIKTVLGKYSKYEGTNRIHSNLDKEDLEEIRMKLKGTSPFTYSEIDRNNVLKFIKDGTSDYYRDWYSEYEMYIANSTDNEKDKINLIIENEKISLDINAVVDSSKIFEDKTMRDINYQIMNVIGTFIPNFMGGSADLFCSTKTYLKGKNEFSVDNYSGRNINFGVRENLMGAVMNGLALTNIRSYGSTFLTFSDYMKPSIRMSAMMELPVTYIFTHDSIRVGEDGPTHEPIEQLGALRSIPGLSVYRPCDYKELIGSWTNILKEGKPAALILPRGHNNTMKYTSPKMVSRGGYIISEVRTRLDLIIIATGSEVELAMNIKEELLKNYIEARVVSMPNMNLFLKQDKEYQEQVFPTGYRKMVIELSNDANWYRFISSDEDFIGVNSFGKSGSEREVLNFFELDMTDLVIKIKNNL
ncbi:MAG: transketolase-like TK C-terminal-containing protein [Bacilli bacterium]